MIWTMSLPEGRPVMVTHGAHALELAVRGGAVFWLSYDEHTIEVFRQPVDGGAARSMWTSRVSRDDIGVPDLAANADGVYFSIHRTACCQDSPPTPPRPTH